MLEWVKANVLVNQAHCLSSTQTTLDKQITLRLYTDNTLLTKNCNSLQNDEHSSISHDISFILRNNR